MINPNHEVHLIKGGGGTPYIGKSDGVLYYVDQHLNLHSPLERYHLYVTVDGPVMEGEPYILVPEILYRGKATQDLTGRDFRRVVQTTNSYADVKKISKEDIEEYISEHNEGL